MISLVLASSLLLMAIVAACDVSGSNSRRNRILRFSRLLDESQTANFFIYEGCVTLVAVCFHLFIVESGIPFVIEPFGDLTDAFLWLIAFLLVQNWNILRFRSARRKYATPLALNRHFERSIDKSPSPTRRLEAILQFLAHHKKEPDLEAMESLLEFLSVRQDEVGVAARTELEAMKKGKPSE